MKKTKNVEQIKEEDNKKAYEEKIALENRKGEFRAFVILLFITLFLIGVVYIWYTKFYDGSEESWLDTIKEKIKRYDAYSYKADDKLSIVGNKYLVEYDDNTLKKVMDLKTDVLFDGELEYSNLYLSKENDLYATFLEDGIEENILRIYKLNDGKWKLVKEYGDLGIYYYPLVRNDGGDKKIMGVVSKRVIFDEETATQSYQTEIELFGDKNYTIDNYVLKNDDIDQKQDIVVNNDKLLIVKSVISGKYGVYNLDNEKIIISPNYTNLEYTSDGNFVAYKNGKAGIIDEKLKIIVDFNYDFINCYDDFYVVGKDNNLTILDKDYKALDNVHIPYRYNPSLNENYFKVYKINDSYAVFVNGYIIREKEEEQIFDSMLYIIDAEGNVNKMNASYFEYNSLNDFAYAYISKDKKYIVFDDKMSEKFSIDVSSYDFTKFNKLYLVNGNTIVVGSDMINFVDYEDGKFIDTLKDYDVTYNNIDVKFDGTKKEVKIYNNQKEVLKYKYENVNSDVLNDNSKIKYYISDNYYVLVD